MLRNFKNSLKANVTRHNKKNPELDLKVSYQKQNLNLIQKKYGIYSSRGFLPIWVLKNLYNHDLLVKQAPPKSLPAEKSAFFIYSKERHSVSRDILTHKYPKHQWKCAACQGTAELG